MAWMKKFIAWAKTLKPVRVLLHFSDSRGFLLAAGLSYHSIFAVFAGVWVGFATFGLILRQHPALSDAFFGLVSRAVPGLLSSATTTGAIDPRDLLEIQALSWTGAIAAVGLVLTALGWLSSCRDAIRALFSLPAAKGNFLLLKLKDLGLAIGFGAALLVSSALLVLSTRALGFTLSRLGIDEHSPIATVLGGGIGLLLMFVLDTAVLATLYRILSDLQIPLRRLLAGALIGAIGLGVLKLLGGALLGGASHNPLLASFAVIVGLLIWFNLVCQVILLAASWIAVGMADDGLAADRRVAGTGNPVGAAR